MKTILFLSITLGLYSLLYLAISYLSTGQERVAMVFLILGSIVFILVREIAGDQPID